MEQKRKNSNFKNSRKWTVLGENILNEAKQELYMSMRYMIEALNGFEFVRDSRFNYVACDGKILYFNPIMLAKYYRQNPVIVNRAYLHMVLHALFRNIYRCGDRNHELWDLSCDIMVEYLIDSLELSCIMQPENEKKTDIYKELGALEDVLSAENIYSQLESMPDDKRKEIQFGGLFKVDDHSLWYKSSKSEQQENQNQSNTDDSNKKEKSDTQTKWDNIAKKMQTELTMYGNMRGDMKGTFTRTLKAGNVKRMPYRDFLKKFAIRKEQMHVDMDSFDYGFYNYGMQMFGNMPLIEELEYKEELKIEDFVIVLDTSGSCAYDKVQKFLDETFQILSENESFFNKINLHIIQCDNQIQSDIIIKSRDDITNFKEQFKIKGFGGTDFRPAFNYINSLCEKKMIKNLKGMLYFTDGYGIYPKKRPSYNTAFIFSKEHEDIEKVPGWAMHYEIVL